MSDTVTIIGAGEIGNALAGVLAKQGRVIELIDKSQKILSVSDIVILCVPTKAIRDVSIKINSLINENTVIATVSKGLDDKGNATFKIMRDLFGASGHWALIGGPMIAEELNNGLGGSAMVASSDIFSYEKISKLFKETDLILEYSGDIVGVSLCGVLKNIYAIALGALKAQKLGKNAEGKLVSQIVGEMDKLVNSFGGKSETVYSLAGLGDLIATGFSPDSSNYQVGFELQSSGFTEKTSEGLLSISQFVKKVDDLEKYPILKRTANLVLNFSPVV